MTANIFINLFAVLFGISAYFAAGFFTGYGCYRMLNARITYVTLLVTILFWPLLLPAIAVLSATEHFGEKM
jgi:hypothetical protein